MKEQTKRSWTKYVKNLLPWLWIAAGYLLDIWYQLVPGKWIVDSDLASDMILANILNQEHAFFSKSWHYSTEIKAVGLHWFYKLGLLIFPNDWQLARTFGMAVGLVLYLFVALLLARCLGLGNTGVWMAGALIWPFGRSYLVYAIYAGYYLVYTFLYMLVLLFLLKSIQKEKRGQIKWLALACVTSTIACLNGVKQLMVFQAPLLLAVGILLVVALYDGKETTWSKALHVCKKEVQLTVGVMATTLFGLFGYVLNAKVLAKMYSFKSFSSVTWSRFGVDWTLDRVLMDFFHLFGYQDEVGVFHFSGIASGVGLLIGAWLFFCIVRLTLRYKKLTVAERLMVLLMLTMLAVCGVSYTYFGNYCVYFWLTCMPVAIAVMAIEIKTEDLHLPGTRELLTVVLAGAMTLCSINNVRQEIEHPTLAHVGLDKVADWLVKNGYKEGYATFWNGSAMVEMTSGQLDVWMPGDLNEIDIEGWLQPDYHLTRYPEHPFILLDTETDGTVESAGLIRNGNGTEVYNDGRYVVYAFDSAEEICAAAETTATERAAAQNNQND